MSETTMTSELPLPGDDDPGRALRQPRLPRPPIYRTVWLLFACFAVCLIGVLALWWYTTSLGHDLASDHKKFVTLYTQAASAGVTPVVTPSNAPTVSVAVTGPAGPAGPGPSTEQVEIAVAAYCAVNKCGVGPTAEQVAQAVASYCNSAGQCRGPAGSSGSPGANGQNGQQGQTGPPGPSGAPGADGQNVTAQQVADAVNSYCSDHGGCSGPPGPTGAPGEPPFSWTYTSALGVHHTCTRTDPFNPAAPTYTCT